VSTKKLHIIKENKIKIRKMINKKSDQKAGAISLWKSGKKITEIARQLNVSRHSVYRWIRLAEVQLKRKKRQSPAKLDIKLITMSIELSVLMRGPSIKKLSSALYSFFGVQIHPAKLRRILIDKSIYPYKPSSQYLSIESNYKNNKIIL